MGTTTRTCFGALLLACAAGLVTPAVATEPAPVKAAEQPAGKAAEQPAGKAAAQPAAKPAAQPYFTVEPQKFELTPGQPADTRVFIIVGNGLPADAEIDQVRDVTKQDGTPVKATFTLRGGYGGGEPRRWSYVGEFSGLGSSYSQKRQLGVLLKDKREYFVDYELTNRPSGSADYTITYDDKWFVDSAQGAFKLTVKANDHAVGPLTLANSTLAIEKRSTTIPVTALVLCTNREGSPCVPVSTLTPNKPTDIYLRVASGAQGDSDPELLPAGSFNGKLKLDAPGVTAAKDVAFNVISTRPWARIWGLAAIVLGVVLSLALMWVRYHAARLAAYQSLLRASETIESLLEMFKEKREANGAAAESSVGTYYRAMQSRIAEYQPKWWDFLVAFVAGGVNVIDAAAATDIQNRVLGLSVMVLQGTTDGRCTKVELEKFGNGTKNLKTEVEAQAFVDKVLEESTVKTTLAAPVAKPTITTAEVSGVIARAGFADAAFYVLVATLVGYFVLIDDKPAFGAIADYITCFLWGLGVPATVQGVKEITKDKLGDTINVKVPVLPGKTAP